LWGSRDADLARAIFFETMSNYYPQKQGLYDPAYEHDSCGVGFVCNINGVKSNTIVRQGLEVLRRLTHRGAVGADPLTGDGAGILIQMPHKFFLKVAKEAKVTLPNVGEYGTGLVFLPTDKDERKKCEDIFAAIVKEEGLELLGWRHVKVNSKVIGETARKTEPHIAQIFIGRGKNIKDELSFERKLYVVRRLAEKAITDSSLKQKKFFYLVNLSCRTFSYKGLLTPDQVETFFADLDSDDIESCLCLVHSRYSTNTFPSWDLAQPFRYLAHNGEINTLRGNVNWMRAREGLLKSEFFGADINKLKPIIVSGGSDSAMLDNVFELLTLSGRSLPHAMMMLVPAAWEQNKLLPHQQQDFYKYHACLTEAWDGPAALAFTDGSSIGALLDRNGLRPARYIVTKTDMIVMASEMGVLDIDPALIAVSGRLEPGKIFFVDTVQKRIIHDEELKAQIANNGPYGAWVKGNLVSLEEKFDSAVEIDHTIYTSLKSFGYTREDLKVIVKPMAETGAEPVGSMGNDIPHAVLSQRPQLMYEYFKQLFAQVTNPPIDPIREEIVMSLDSYLGASRNILEATKEHCHKVHVKHPVLTNSDFKTLSGLRKTKFISILFGVKEKDGFRAAVERVKQETVKAAEDGYEFIVLSDRGVDEKDAPLPVLFITGCIHHHLTNMAMRTRVAIILETGEPREVHHFALLFGYGADCINPYGAYEAIQHLISDRELELSFDAAQKKYLHAVEHGLMKILSKMGISTLASYRGAQIFEAIGIGDELV